jgi:tetratricopeptide (TPR) repeat protein
MKRVEICNRADDVYVRELRLTHQKSSQSTKGFCEAPVEAASPGQGIACDRFDRDLLIPEVEVDHPVTGATGRSVGKSPNSISAIYSLALLQKYRRQYHASMRSLQRNPSFLPAQGQIGNLLTRLGQPQKGLEQILQTIRVATPNDPTTGYWYLFAAEAELELDHDRAALDWALRANAFMPGSPLVQAWLASIYTTIGDKSNAAKSVAALTKIAPDRTRLFMSRPIDTNNVSGRRGPRIFDGLRLALGASLG